MADRWSERPAKGLHEAQAENHSECVMASVLNLNFHINNTDGTGLPECQLRDE